MMLSQIERRLTQFKTEVDMQEADKQAHGEKAPGSKIVAIDVDPEMYAQLQEISKKHGVRGVRGALILAAKAGIRHL